MAIQDKILIESNNSDNKQFLSVIYVSAYTVRISTPLFAFQFDNSDLFINQIVSLNVPIQRLRCHGLFGQTHKNLTKSEGEVKSVEGFVDDYVLLDQDKDELFGISFMYNRFVSK